MTDAPKPAILYVDDEHGNRLVFEQSFGRKFTVVTAQGGAEALELLRDKSRAIGVVVSDARMPNMTGHELLAQVKHLYPDVVRIVITAYSDLDSILRAVNDGLVARYLVKPWDRAELETVLRWALEVHARGQEDSAIQLRLLQAERLATLGSMAASVLHDLSQPITAAETNTTRLLELAESASALTPALDVLSASLPDASAGALRDLIEEMPGIASDLSASLEVFRGLLAQLKELSRPPPRDMIRRVDPTEVLRFVTSACRTLTLKARARLICDAPAQLPSVAMTFTELTQVLTNVVSNAIQAVEVAGREGTVTLTLCAREGNLEIVVVDDGCGVPADLLPKLGTPFLSTRSEGTGLGVSQCRRLVAAAGGTFRIESTEGTGTTVRLTVPLATAPTSG